MVQLTLFFHLARLVDLQNKKGFRDAIPKPALGSESCTPAMAFAAILPHQVEGAPPSAEGAEDAGPLPPVAEEPEAPPEAPPRPEDLAVALSEAAAKGDAQQVRELLLRGADVQGRDGNEFGHTALQQTKSLEVARVLIEHAADVNAKDQFGHTVLHEAALDGEEMWARLLVEHRADVNAKDEKGNTALTMAARRQRDGPLLKYVPAHRGHVEVARLLVEHRADMNAKNMLGCQALILALAGRLGQADLARLLVERGADVHAKDEDGRTALILAAQGGEEICARLLVEHGADVNAKDKDGRTAMKFAVQNGCVKVAGFLAEKGAALDAESLVPLLLGEGSLYTEVVEAMLQTVPCRSRQHRVREHIRTVLLPAELYRGDMGPDFFMNEDLTVHQGNLFDAPMVDTSLQVLDQFAATLARHPRVLQAIAETANNETLATDTVELIIQAAWQQMRLSTMLDIVQNVACLACLLWVTYVVRFGEPRVQLPLWLLLISFTKEAVEWLWQVARRAAFCSGSSGLDLEMLADASFLVVALAAVVSQMQREAELDQLFLPWCAAMAWLRGLYSLRGERWIGRYMLPILSAVRDTGAFFFVTALCLAAASHAYFILNPRGEDPYPIYSAFLHTARLGLFGDFDVFEYQGQDATYQLNDYTNEWEPQDPSPKDLGQQHYVYLQLSFFTVGVGMTILLMNLLIGILSQHYEIHQERAQILFIRARARMLLEHTRRPWATLTASGASLAEVRDESKSFDYYTSCRTFLLACSLYPLKFVFGQPVFDWFGEAVLERVELKSTSRCGGIATAITLLLLPVLLCLSLSVACPFGAVALALRLLGVRLQGLQRAMSEALLGRFQAGLSRTGPHLRSFQAFSCHIFGVVRKDANADDLRGMRSDLKERMQTMQDKIEKLFEGKMQESVDKIEKLVEGRLDKIEKLVQVLAPRAQRQMIADSESGEETLFAAHRNTGESASGVTGQESKSTAQLCDSVPCLALLPSVSLECRAIEATQSLLKPLARAVESFTISAAACPFRPEPGLTIWV